MVPLQFQIARFLNNVCAAAGTFVPIGPHLVEILEQVDNGKKTKRSMIKVPDIKFAIKATKATITTKQYQETVIKTCVSLLLDHFANYSYSVAFPELIVPIKAMLKRQLKNSRVKGMKKSIHVLLDKLDANSQFIHAHRTNLDYSPQDMVKNEVSFEAALQKDKGGKGVVAPLKRYVELQQQGELGEEGPLMSADEVEKEAKRLEGEKKKRK